MHTIKQYLMHLQTEGKSKNTILTYNYHLKRYRKWIEDNQLTKDEITTQQLIQFKEQLNNEAKTDRTINAIISAVRGYYDYLLLEGTLMANPVAHALTSRVKSKVINPLTIEQQQLFLSHIETLKENVRAAFHVMIGTGARVGEVTSLKKTDFQLLDNKLIINIEDAKWGSDRRIPVMKADSARIIFDYIMSINVYSEPAFRISKRTLQTHADKFRKKTGIDFNCHILRHTFASDLLEKQIPIEKIQYLLGHKSVNMTRHYTQGANIDVRSLAPTIWQDVPKREDIKV